MNYTDIVAEFRSHEADQFSVKFDVSKLPERLAEIKTEMARHYDTITTYLIASGSDILFNHNSAVSKILLMKKFGLDPKTGSADEAKILAGSSPEVDAFLALGPLEHERRYIEGNKKGENSFVSYVKPDGTFHPEMVMTEGRVYFNRMYTLPKEMRKFVHPLHEGKKFLYFDLSAAELTTLGYMANCQQVIEDCLSGTFWDYWYETLNLDKSFKEDIKVAIYSCIYSLSDYKIPVTVPKKFFHLFFARYKELYFYLYSVQRKALQTKTSPGMFEQEIVLPFYAGEPLSKLAFRSLNLPVSYSLSHVAMEIANFIIRKGYYVATMNFDSFLVEVSGEEDASTLLSNIEDFMKETGLEYKYKYNIGDTYASAQYGV